MPAGDNERLFRNLIRERFGNILQGKRVWRSEGSRRERVEISVDESIETPNYRLLVEIDSGNYAKLIVGQYVLMNALNNDAGNRQDVFVVIHYNVDNGRPYDPQRTLKNLNLVNQSVLNNSGINFIVFNVPSFVEFLEGIESIEELDQRISEEIQRLNS